MSEYQGHRVTGRKTIVYIAMSLDGYIAKPGDDLSFLSMAFKEGEDYGYAEFMSGVDTVIMGRKTYDWIMKQVPVFPHVDLESYIITRTEKPGSGKLKFFTGNLLNLVERLKSATGGNIFIDGGAEIVTELLHGKLIDEFIITVFPVLLGEGIRLFPDGRPEQMLNLVRSSSYETGLVQLHYTVRD